MVCPSWFLELPDALYNDDQETLGEVRNMPYFSGYGNYTAHLGPHRETPPPPIQGHRQHRPGVLFSPGSRVGVQDLQAHCLLVNLKQKSRSQSAGREKKKQVAQVLSYQRQPRSLTKGA